LSRTWSILLPSKLIFVIVLNDLDGKIQNKMYSPAAVKCLYLLAGTQHVRLKFLKVHSKFFRYDLIAGKCEIQ
jgi:hypothetical protein